MSENTNKTVNTDSVEEVDVKEKKDFKKILSLIRGVLEDEETDAETPEVAAEEVLESSPEATVSAAKPSLRGRFKLIFGNRLINRLAIFLIAVIMLVMTFMPMVTYRVQMADEAVYSVGYSGVDNVQISLFSLFVGSSTGELDLSGYETALAGMTDPAAKVSLIRQMTIASSVYSMRGLQTSALLATLLYAVYVLLCVIFVIVAAVNLMAEFFTGKKTMDKVKKFASDGLLCFLVCMMPALFYIMLQACEICTGEGVLGFVRPVVGASLSWQAVLTLVLGIVGVILACASHSLGLLRVDRRYFDRKRIKHILAIVLVVVVMLSTLMPFLQVYTIDVQSGKEMALGMNLWEVREFTTQEWLAYYNNSAKIDKDYLATLGAMPVLPAHMGEIFINTMFITSDAASVYTIYFLMELITLFMLAFAGLWMYGLLRRGFFGKKRRGMINTFKIFTLICVCISFFFVLILKSTLDMCLAGELMYVMQFALGGGMLLMFLCTILGVVLRLREKREIVYADEDYDNALVSTGYGYTVPKQAYVAHAHSGIGGAAKTLMTISMIAMSLMPLVGGLMTGAIVLGIIGAVIPLAWCLPMTIVYSKSLKRGEPVGTGFKVCTILFINLAAGILMFCDNR